MISRRKTIAVVLLAMALATLDSAAAVAVKDLSDADFEHLTQAATGQTTGVWLCAFAPGGATGALRAALGAAAASSGRTVIAASVDTTSATRTAARFGLLDEQARSNKKVILFRDRKMYEFTGSLAPHEGQADEFLAFATDPVSSSSASEAKEVPPPPSPVAAAVAAATAELEAVVAKIQHLVEPHWEKVRPHVETALEKVGVPSGSLSASAVAVAAAPAALGLGAVAAVAAALAGKKRGSSRGSSSPARRVTRSQTTRRTKRA